MTDLTDLTHIQKAEKFHKLAGLHWHEPHMLKGEQYLYFQCACGANSLYSDAEDFTNPTYSDPREVLKVMEERDDFLDFARKYLCVDESDFGVFVPIEILTGERQDALLDAAIEFMEGK